jgi:hypothetical protein
MRHLKFILIPAIFTLIALSCVSVEKQRGRANAFFLAHPSELAEKCATTYPIVDSTGAPVITYKPADNTNYKGQIDSLTDIANQLTAYSDALATELHKRGLSVDSTPQYRALTISYKTTLKELQNRLDALKNQYKPCNPDTASILQPIYRKSTAELAAVNFRADSLLQAKQRTDISLESSQKSGKKLLWILICSILANIVFVIYIIKKL